MWNFGGFLEFDGQREGNWKGLILEVLQECQNFTDVILWKIKERHKIMDVIYKGIKRLYPKG